MTDYFHKSLKPFIDEDVWKAGEEAELMDFSLILLQISKNLRKDK